MRAAFELTSDVVDAVQLTFMACENLFPSDAEPVSKVESTNDLQGRAAILALFDACLAKPAARSLTLAAWMASGRFHVGQRVMCVDDGFSTREDWRRAAQALPKLHSIYTIRSICWGGSLIGFCFYELTNPPAEFPGGIVEPAFNSKKFRPLTKANVDIIEKLLATSDVVDARQASRVRSAAVS
ncbi:MAG TPA: hypothetical protein VKT73_02560 [Xanthobacteraceae bacterium]|nr:hypothetical protein [Xanthobacteraceae bacterium]